MPFPETLTNEQIVHEVICNRAVFSLREMESILASILDPVTIQHNETTRFVVSLPCIKPADLGPEPEDQNCAVCLNKYGREDHLDEDTPAKLPCGHIMGAGCIKTWLEQRESCPLCRKKVFTRPVVSGHLNDPKLEQVARDFLFFAKTYLLEEKTTIFTNEELYMRAMMRLPWMYDDYSSFVAWAKKGDTVVGHWNRYRYGWSGRTVWKDLDQFRTVCGTIAHCFILRMDEKFKPNQKKGSKTVLLKSCMRCRGVGHERRSV